MKTTKDKHTNKSCGAKASSGFTDYHGSSKPKKRTEKRTDLSLLPAKFKEEVKQKRSLSRQHVRQNVRESIQRIAIDHFVNSTKRKAPTSSKTPKSGQTWLVRDVLQKDRLLEPRKSKSRLQPRTPLLHISPKAIGTIGNAFTYASTSFHSSKAASGRYVRCFGRPSDVRQSVQARSKSKGPVRLKTQADVGCYEEETQKWRTEEKEYECREDLTEEEYGKFGDRFPGNFEKVGLLGRGGFSLVWLGVQRKTKRKLAIKQILTKNPHQTHLKEIWFGSFFLTSGGEPRQEFADHIGINNICRLLAYDIKPVDTWLFYELCEESLGSSLYELTADSVNTESKFYSITYKPLLTRFREDPNELKRLLIEICKGLTLLSAHNIVHSDLKTENILLNLRKKQQRTALQPSILKSVKIIDFGSSFLFTNLKQFSMATPQYMPPQILNYILFQNDLAHSQHLLQKLSQYKNPWVIDIWSAGCIMLQILSGIPIWMSINTRIEHKNTYATGLFAVKGRVFSEIIAKQIQVVKRLDWHLEVDCHSGIRVTGEMRGVLKRMMSLEPEQRVSPREVLRCFGIRQEEDRVPCF